MGRVQQSLSFLNYRFRSQSRFDIHSPFVFELVTKVFRDRTLYPAYAKIEAVRAGLLKDERIIRINDLGAGSQVNGSSQRKIKDICRNAEKNSKYGRLLFRLVSFFKPGIVIDLGTSLGITTLYLSEGNPAGKILTIEGCPETA